MEPISALLPKLKTPQKSDGVLYQWQEQAWLLLSKLEDNDVSKISKYFLLCKKWPIHIIQERLEIALKKEEPLKYFWSCFRKS